MSYLFNIESVTAGWETPLKSVSLEEGVSRGPLEDGGAAKMATCRSRNGKRPRSGGEETSLC